MLTFKKSHIVIMGDMPHRLRILGLSLNNDFAWLTFILWHAWNTIWGIMTCLWLAHVCAVVVGQYVSKGINFYNSTAHCFIFLTPLVDHMVIPTPSDTYQRYLNFSFNENNLSTKLRFTILHCYRHVDKQWNCLCAFSPSLNRGASTIVPPPPGSFQEVKTLFKANSITGYKPLLMGALLLMSIIVITIHKCSSCSAK